MSFMIVYGFLKISKTMICVAKITIRSSFSCLVSYFSSNFEALFLVVYCFLKISKANIGVAKITIRCTFS